jgi:hypothetical protein
MRETERQRNHTKRLTLHHHYQLITITMNVLRDTKTVCYEKVWKEKK